MQRRCTKVPTKMGNREAVAEAAALAAENMRLRQQVLAARVENSRLLAMAHQSSHWMHFNSSGESTIFSADCDCSASDRESEVTGSTVADSVECIDLDESSDDELSSGKAVPIQAIGAPPGLSLELPLVAQRPCFPTAPLDASTTVIMRNIPNRHTRSMLVDLLDRNGFRAKYDLVYLPMDFSTNVAFGYAFVNFTDSFAAAQFMAHFQGFNQWGCNSEKVCSVAWSKEQGGLEMLIRRYRNCSVMHESVPDSGKPALYSAGKRVPFPAPTRRVKPPQAEHERRSRKVF